MKIIIFYSNDKKLRDLFNNYDNNAKKIISSKGMSQMNAINETSRYSREIEKYIIDNLEKRELKIVDESFYDENIKTPAGKNLLMNGLYEENDISKLLKQYNNEITLKAKAYFEQIVKNITNNHYVFFWNTGEETANAIIQG